jgi:hypothetical protein
MIESLEGRTLLDGDFGTAWAIGSTRTDEARAVATDAAGHVYIAGNIQGTADFDPGPGVVSVTPSSPPNAFVQNAFLAKYTRDGALVWARAFDAPGVSSPVGFAADLAVSDSGEAHILVGYNVPFDADPGAGSLSLPAGGYVIKLDASGNLVRAMPVSSRNSSGGSAGYRRIALDGSGNVHLIGNVNGATDLNPVDVDPGPGVFNLSRNNSPIVLKLTPDGHFLWARSPENGTFTSTVSIGINITVDDAGNIYSTGNNMGGEDWDPGPGLTVLPEGAFVWKLDSNGEFLWAKGVAGSQGNNGAQGHGIAADPSGNVYTVGRFGGTVDLDPGPGIHNITSVIGPFGITDLYVLKLDSAGNFIWGGAMGGPGQEDYVDDLAADSLGNIYLTGTFQDTMDFDPGPGVYPLTSAGLYDGTAEAGSRDAFVAKFDAAGNLAWARAVGSSHPYDAGLGDKLIDDGDDLGRGIAVDPSGLVFAVGSFSYTADFEPGAGTYELTAAGGSNAWDAFVLKLLPDAGVTLPGENIYVEPEQSGVPAPPMSITFDTVTSAGTTTITTSHSTNGPGLPPNFTLAGDVYYELSTTASFDSAAVCIDYDESKVADEPALKLFHYENGAWVDVTTSLDTTNDVICGNVTSFSPFALAEPGRTVQIDIKRDGSAAGSINLASEGVISVAILTTPDFDAATVDVGSVVFADASPIASQVIDSDGDGDQDLVLYFRTQETSLRATYEQLLLADSDADGVLDSTRQLASIALTGRSNSGELLRGFDQVNLFLSGKALRTLLDELNANGLI